MASPFGQKHGSAMIESCIVVALLCLILFGLLQTSYIISSRNVINYATVATTRAAAVGMNNFMLHKVSHYATIPTAGPNASPGIKQELRLDGETVGEQWRNALSRADLSRSTLGAYELGVREGYHMSSVSDHASILNYDNWKLEETDIHFTVEEDSKLDILHVTLEQNLPLVYPLSRAVFSHLGPVRTVRGKRAYRYPGLPIKAEYAMEDHSKFYLRAQ